MFPLEFFASRDFWVPRDGKGNIAFSRRPSTGTYAPMWDASKAVLVSYASQDAEAARLDPLSVMPVHDLAINDPVRHRFDAAAAGFRKTIDLDPDWTWGYIKLARQKLDELHAIAAKQYVDPVTFAIVLGALGRIDDAVAWYEQAYADRTPTWWPRRSFRRCPRSSWATRGFRRSSTGWDSRPPSADNARRAASLA